MAANNDRPEGAWVPPAPVLEPDNPHLTKPPEQRVSGHELAWSCLGSPLINDPADYYGSEGEN